MKKYKYDVTKVSMRTLDLSRLNEFGKKGFRVVAHTLHGADLIMVLEREEAPTAKSAKKAEE